MTYITKIALVFLAVTSISCRDVIFDTVRGEVELDDAKVSGDINSIVRFTIDSDEYLFADNGRIWFKDITQTSEEVTTTLEDGTTETKTVFTNNPTQASPYGGKWQEGSKEGIGDAHIIHLAADQNTLYALTGVLEKDSDTGYNVVTKKTLYYSDGKSPWQEVKWVDAEGGSTSVTIAPKLTSQLYCTNAPQKAHRFAYLTLESAFVYELKDGVATQMKGTGSDTGVYTGTPTTACVSCAWFKDAVYFSSYSAMITDETKDLDPSVMYYGSGSDLYYIKKDKEPTEATNWTKGISLSTIYALAYTTSHMLAGTKEGLMYVTLDADDVPGTKVSVSNTSSTLSSYYRVPNVIAADPSDTATTSDIYATSVIYGSTTSTGASVKNEGLWSYYPGRGKWNRE